MDNYINVDNLPRDNRGKISWKESIGMIINFCYNDIQGEFKILNKEKDDLTVEYNGNEYTVLSYNLMKCQLRNIVSPIVDYFLYDVGDIVKHRFGEYEILDRFTETKNGKFRRFYKTICSNCGDEKDLNQDIFMRNTVGCRGCSNKIAILGKNTIYDLHRWALEYIDEDTSKENIPLSGKRIDVTCPECGFVKNMQIKDFIINNMRCPMCSDGISFPEKILNYIFKKSNITYIYQYTSKNAEWVGNYRYDFLLSLPIGETVCESNGEFHYSDTNGFKQSLDEIKINDKNKKKLAIDNNKIFVEIDCRVSEVDYIINNLKSSILSEYIDFENLDYKEMKLLKSNSIMVDVCKYHMNLKEYESNKDIAKKFNISSHTVNKYYRTGIEIFDWFIYEPSKHKPSIKEKKIRKKNNSREIYVFDSNWIFINKFYGARNTSDKLSTIFNVNFSESKICSVLKGERKHHNGFHFLEKPSMECDSHES